jgi:hypothetical protein
MDREKGKKNTTSHTSSRRRKICQSPLSSPHHYKWGGLNLSCISVLRWRRQGTLRSTIVIPPSVFTPITNFATHVTGAKEFNKLPHTSEIVGFFYALEVYVDDFMFMSIVVPTSQEQLDHVAMTIMTGIHDVFPADIVDSNDLISKKKL